MHDNLKRKTVVRSLELQLGRRIRVSEAEIFMVKGIVPPIKFDRTWIEQHRCH